MEELGIRDLKGTNSQSDPSSGNEPLGLILTVRLTLHLQRG